MFNLAIDTSYEAVILSAYAFATSRMGTRFSPGPW